MNTSLAPPKIAFLHDRAEMLGEARAFFKERHVREVDCPLVSASASVDLHIDLIPCVDVLETGAISTPPQNIA